MGHNIGMRLMNSALQTALAHALDEIQTQSTNIPPEVRGRLTGLLLDQWFNDTDRPRTTTMRRQLLRTLRELQPEDAAFLTAAQRERLHFELRRQSNDPILLPAIVEALGRIGDHDALPLLRPLSDGKGAAVDCLSLQQAAQASVRQLEAALRANQ